MATHIIVSESDGREADLSHLVLIGGGHAHLDVLRSLAEDDWPPVAVTLVSPRRRQAYSGMVPGYLQGRYDAGEISLDLAALCRGAGASFLEASVERVSTGDRVVWTTEGPIPFTHASLDVGSVPPGIDLPGVRAHAHGPGPLEAAVRLRRDVDDRIARTGRVRIAVVGAGAAGIEVALALNRRALNSGGAPTVTLVERGSRILAGETGGFRRRAERALGRAGVRIATDHEVVRVEPDAVRFADGSAIGIDLVAWVTGAAPPPLAAASRLPQSDAGYFLVDRTLRSADGEPVWGAGDCVDVAGYTLPKAGVFAVRQGPVLTHNLRAALVGTEPREYAPRRAYLSLLNTADGRAILRWRGAAWHSALAGSLKDRIDRRFMDRYEALARGRPDAGGADRTG